MEEKKVKRNIHNSSVYNHGKGDHLGHLMKGG
jgi:hypothetical protein